MSIQDKKSALEAEIAAANARKVQYYVTSCKSDIHRRRRVYTAKILEEMEIDACNLPEGSKLIYRIMSEEVDASFLPCDYVRHFEDGTDAEVTKTSQAIA